MQLLVAHALDAAASDDEVAARLARVERHYARLWRVPIARHGQGHGGIGVTVWDAAESPWRWPSWQADGDIGVATLYAPLGYERVIGERPADTSAIPLARALLQRPERVLELTPPFVIATIEPELRRLSLINDSLGLGRLFQLRFPGGWVWSNRPAATCLFAGITARPDPTGWRTNALTQGFMGDTTPIEQVFAVRGGTLLAYDRRHGRVQSRIAALGVLAAGRRGNPLLSERVDELAASLRGVARSIERVWPGELTVDLSGGRDSRLVSAAFLSAGVPVRLRTTGDEADIAEQLVAAQPRTVEHEVDREGPKSSADDRDRPGVIERVLGWHRYQEGLRPSSYLPYLPPNGLYAAERLAISGAGGEVAHGRYYPPDFREIVELPLTERLDVFATRLTAGLGTQFGRAAATVAATETHVRRLLHQGVLDGIDDARLMNYFYIDERLRRYGTVPERHGIVAPLVSPEFVRAAFDMTSDQRSENALHRAITARLIPEWADIPYYEQPAGRRIPSLRPRLAADAQRDLVTAIVLDPQPWEGCFDPEVVEQAWRRMLDEAGTHLDEHLLQQVIWQAVYSDFLAEVNDTPAVMRDPVTLAPPPLEAEPVTPAAPVAVSVAARRPRGRSRLHVVARQPWVRAILGHPGVVRGRRLTARVLRKVAVVVEPRRDRR